MAAPSSVLRESARAKINLYLEVKRRRSDGYHDIETLFQRISLADEVAIRSRGGTGPDRLTVSGANISAGSDNLVLRAVFAARRAGVVVPPLDIALKKNVPVGAGLGGGSSDAAAVLRALARFVPGPRRPMFRSHVAPAIAAALGADVPFFLGSGAAWGRGTGTLLEPVKSRSLDSSWRIVLVFPGIFVPTPWVYKRLSGRFPLTNPRGIHTLYRRFNRGAHVGSWAPLLFNRLEEVVLPRYPAVAEAKQALLKAGCLAALMSGSGSSVFGIIENESSGRNVIQKLVRRPRWKVWLARPAF